jgi:hypothetical protein
MRHEEEHAKQEVAEEYEEHIMEEHEKHVEHKA